MQCCIIICLGVYHSHDLLPYFIRQAIIVLEGDHLKLTCAASGFPKPTISWNRLDGNAVPDGSWRGMLGMQYTLLMLL